MTEPSDTNCQNLFSFKQDTNQSYFSILPNQTIQQNNQPQHSFSNSQSQNSFSHQPPIRNQQHHKSKSDDDKSVQSSDYIDPSPLTGPNNNNTNINPKSSDIVYTDLNNLQYIIQKQQQLLLSSLKDNNAITDDQKVIGDDTADIISDRNGANLDKNGGKINGDAGVEGGDEFEWKLKVRSDGSRYNIKFHL